MTGRTLRRELSVPLVVFTSLVAGLGVLGVVAVMLSTRAVTDVTARVAPLRTANAAVLQDLTDAETGLRGWALSGRRWALEPYRSGTGRLPADLDRLRSLAQGDAALATLVDAQHEAVEAWLADYAEERLGRGGGRGTFDPRLFARGTARFDAVRAANGEVAAYLVAAERRAETAAQRRLGWTVVVMAAAVLVALAVGLYLSRRLRRALQAPLEDLEATARRLAAGEHDARARTTGPEEVVHVARALNALADGNDRARDAEAAVRERVAVLDSAHGDFVANVSHELRTPLTTISGYLELVEDEFAGRLEPRHEQMLESVQRNVARLRDLIEDLLTLTRAENRSTDLTAVDLVALVEDVVDEHRMAARRRDITVRVLAPHSAAAVLADRGQLSRVLDDLLDNAVKFSHEGGVVEVSLRPDGEQVVVTVEDHGIGIPADELPLVGTRFFRASNAVADEYAGTGLGLRIVETIVGHHGGRLDLSSEQGVGTTVSLTLPRVGG